eukprot:scaffold13881_cov124-Isochrysis_galbana.AAC.7
MVAASGHPAHRVQYLPPAPYRGASVLLFVALCGSWCIFAFAIPLFVVFAWFGRGRRAFSSSGEFYFLQLATCSSSCVFLVCALRRVLRALAHAARITITITHNLQRTTATKTKKAENLC